MIDFYFLFKGFRRLDNSIYISILKALLIVQGERVFTTKTGDKKIDEHSEFQARRQAKNLIKIGRERSFKRV